MFQSEESCVTKPGWAVSSNLDRGGQSPTVLSGLKPSA